MSLLQVKIDDRLQKALKKKSKLYGVPVSSLVRIILIKAFVENENDMNPGNVFNADRDNGGQGISIDNIIAQL